MEDTLENHYDNLLVGAEQWAIDQVKEHIKKLELEINNLKAELHILDIIYEQV